MSPNVDVVTVSIIIPTYNRPEQLYMVLENIALQKFPLHVVQVVVADDGSKTPYDRVTTTNWPFQLDYFWQVNQGEIPARNEAVKQAKGKYLVFLDDDIFIEPDYIPALIADLVEYPLYIVLGVLFPKINDRASKFQVAMFKQATTDLSGDVPVTECGSGTMSMDKELFEKLGGMRTLGPGGRNAWGGMDFAYRASELGYRVRRCSEAKAVHDDYAFENLETYSKRMQKVSRMAVLHFQRVPHLLPEVAMFHDKTPIEIGKDPAQLIVKKSLRKIISSHIAVKILGFIVKTLESFDADPAIIRPLYRWIIGASIYRGFNEGLIEYGMVKR